MFARILRKLKRESQDVYESPEIKERVRAISQNIQAQFDTPAEAPPRKSRFPRGKSLPLIHQVFDRNEGGPLDLRRATTNESGNWMALTEDNDLLTPETRAALRMMDVNVVSEGKESMESPEQAVSQIEIPKRRQAVQVPNMDMIVHGGILKDTATEADGEILNETRQASLVIKKELIAKGRYSCASDEQPYDVSLQTFRAPPTMEVEFAVEDGNPMHSMQEEEAFQNETGRNSPLAVVKNEDTAKGGRHFMDSAAKEQNDRSPKTHFAQPTGKEELSTGIRNRLVSFQEDDNHKKTSHKPLRPTSLVVQEIEVPAKGIPKTRPTSLIVENRGRVECPIKASQQENNEPREALDTWQYLAKDLASKNRSLRVSAKEKDEELHRTCQALVAARRELAVECLEDVKLMQMVIDTAPCDSREYRKVMEEVVNSVSLSERGS